MNHTLHRKFDAQKVAEKLIQKFDSFDTIKWPDSTPDIYKPRWRRSDVSCPI
jgi:hypothetical protein